MRLRYAVFIALFALVAALLMGPLEEDYAQQNALGNLVQGEDAGYEINGMPQYNGARWTIFVKVPDC